ncbi:MAG: AmmeMemoRadiSam system radical SAM enzyme [Promethearchaeota archaeon]
MEHNKTPFFKKVKYQKRINRNVSQCLTCERKCNISEGNFGACQTRINYRGNIYSIIYGCIPALSINPIEKKPLFHFYPGTSAITIGTYGCNFSCFWCQNYHISHPDHAIDEDLCKKGEYIHPSRLIEIAKQKDCKGTSISFNEPTLLFEYSLEVFKLAKNEGLYNTYVSNGYMTLEVLQDLIEAGLNAINVDVKGSKEMVRKYCGADVEIIWRNAKMAKESGVHVEITTLLIENFNTNPEVIKQIVQRIKKDLGQYTPFHLTRAFPQYKSKEFGFLKPTSIEVLKESYNIAKEAGLKYVYIGNLTDPEFETTICPNCSKTVIKRKVFGVSQLLIDDKGNCQYCGFPICRL